MYNDISTEERIDNYLLGRMTDQERQLFEAEIEKDMALKEELEYQRQIANAVQRAAMSKFLRQQMEQSRKPKTINIFSSTKKVIWTITSIAAMFIVVIGGVNYTRTVNAFKDEGISIYNNLEIPVARDGNQIDILISKAYFEIGNEQFDHAMESISKARLLIDQQVALLNGSTEEVDYERQLLQLKKEDLDIYEVVIYLKKGKIVKAKKALKKIAGTNGTYSKKVREQLDLILH